MTKTITVSTVNELNAALKTSSPKDTILLKGGDYGSFTLSAKSKMDLNFEGVTVKSADPEDPAVFRSMALDGVSNLVVEGVVFDYEFKAGDPAHLRPFSVVNSTGVTIKDSVFDGDTAAGMGAEVDGHGTGYGLTLRGGSDITIEGNEFTGWMRGATFQEVKDLKVIDNEIHDIRSDGFNFISIAGALIEGNAFHDFRAAYGSGDHTDMIQFWTNGTKKPSVDIIIRSNTFDIGEGSFTQTIFMRNEEVDKGRAGKEMFYKNVVIENNTIYNSHAHGITVGEVDGLIIKGNSLMAVADANNPSTLVGTVWVPKIQVATGAQNVQIIDNMTSAVVGFQGQSGWHVANNLLIQNTNPFGENYYGDLFISSSMEPKAGAHGYVAIPGGVIDQHGVGSLPVAAPEVLGAQALYMTKSLDPYTWSFDASLTAKLLGAQAADAIFLWSFGDGTTAQGAVANHVYSQAKAYDVSLTVVLKGGSVLAAGGSVTATGHEIIHFDGGAGSFVAHQGGEYTAIAPITSLDGDAIQFAANTAVATINRSYLSALYGSDSFAIDFSMKADEPGAAGEIFRLHNSFHAVVTAQGKLQFTIFNEAGQRFTLDSQATQLHDGRHHEIAIRVEGGQVQLQIDGALSGSVDFTGTLPSSGSWDLSFGNPWGKQNFGGDISEFSIELIADRPALLQPPAPVEVAPVVPELPATPALPPEAEAPSVPVIVPPAPEPEPVPVPEQPAGNHLALDIPALTDKANLRGAAIVGQEGKQAVRFDGVDDYVDLGRQAAIDTSDRIAFSVDFSRAGDMLGEERLIWNHMKIGLSLKPNSLLVQVATTEGFKSFSSSKLDLKTTEAQNIVVMLDRAEDHLQVLFNDTIVLDVSQGVDFDVSGMQPINWTIGTPWNRYFEGEVTDFRLTDTFDFATEGSSDIGLWL